MLVTGVCAGDSYLWVCSFKQQFYLPVSEEMVLYFCWNYFSASVLAWYFKEQQCTELGSTALPAFSSCQPGQAVVRILAFSVRFLELENEILQGRKKVFLSSFGKVGVLWGESFLYSLISALAVQHFRSFSAGWNKLWVTWNCGPEYSMFTMPSGNHEKQMSNICFLRYMLLWATVLYSGYSAFLLSTK